MKYTTERGGPPRYDEGLATPSQTDVQEVDNHTNVAKYTAGLRRRRAASYRLPVLESGRRDPWYYDHPGQPSEKMVTAYRDAVLFVFDAGMTPAAFVPEMRALWRRGGDDQRLVRDICEHWELSA